MIEFFRTQQEAERMLAEVIRDEPDWLEHFRIERIALHEREGGFLAGAADPCQCFARD